MTELELLKQENEALRAERASHVLQLSRFAADGKQHAATVRQQLTLLEQKDALLSEQSETIRKQETRLEAQQLEINRLIQLKFGRRSERYLANPRQMQLDFGDSPAVADATDGLQQAVDEKARDDAAAAGETITVAEHSRKKQRKPRNDSLPANLPRIESIADVDDEDKHCDTHGPKVLIGYDVTETLVYTPPKLEVHATKYPKYACSNQPQCGVTQKARPEGLVAGNRYDTGVAAEIITAKYAYHLPYYRQQDRRRRLVWSCRSANSHRSVSHPHVGRARRDLPAVAGRPLAAPC